MDEEIRHIKPLYQLLRSAVYTGILLVVFIFLANLDFIKNTYAYEFIALIGFSILIIEAYFTSKYLRLNRDKSFNIYHFSEHLINHLFYPSISVFSLIFYLLIEKNISFSYVLITISSIIFFVYFYYLPFHIHYDHIGHPAGHMLSPRINFIFHIFKFFTYFISILTLYTFYFKSLVSIEFVLGCVFLINFIFLFFHIFRKDKLEKINVFMTILFAFITTLFISFTPFARANLSTAITVLYFYLASSVFYHKVDGTFSYKILIEYSSIAIIISILLFTLE